MESWRAPGAPAEPSLCPGAPAAAKVEAARDIDKALESGWSRFEIAGLLRSLKDIERAHEFVEHPTRRGRMIGGT
jgi:hypothetical protein